MKLNTEQRNKVREEHGICCNEACDRCGKMLNEVRWTRRGESGEWCSRECRDGLEKAQLIEVRIAIRAGRPRLRLSKQDRTVRRRQQIREAVRNHRGRRNSADVIKNTLVSI